MVQAEVNRELACLGADLSSPDMSKGYIIWSKSKVSSGAEENNVLSLHTITNDDNEEALTGAATALSIFSVLTDNSTSWNLSLSPVSIKFYYCHLHHFFLY